MSLVMTREQLEICESNHSRIVVEANAGAGKTTLAAMKIASLIAKGANPSKIMALSYTEAGVQAYYEAFSRVGITKNIVNLLRVGTFEEFCSTRLARLEGLKIDQIQRPEQVRPYVLAAISNAREWAQEKFGDIFNFDGGGEFAVEGLLRDFSNIKGTLEIERAPEGFTVSPYWSNELGRDFTTLAIFNAYERLRCHSVDLNGETTPFRYIGDATYDLARVLMDDDPIYSKESNPLRLGLEAVILDEMHDTNWAMFTVLKELLAINEGAIFLGVGDRDQVVHLSNGADSYFMGEGFGLFISKPKFMPLTETYRFDEKLAKPLGRVAGKRYQASSSHSSQLRIRNAETAKDVYEIIAEAMTTRLGMAPRSLNSEIAVLFRYPHSATDVEHRLRERAIPYRAVGFTTYLERPEVLFVRLLLGASVKLKEQFGADVLLASKRATWEFIGGDLPKGEGRDATEAAIENSSYEDFVQFILRDLIARTPDSEARLCVERSMHIASSDRIEDLGKALSALQIQRLARRVFVKNQDVLNAQASVDGLVRAGKDYSSISDFLVSLLSHDYASHKQLKSDNCIRISSVEAAKGLEFEHVIFANATEFDERRTGDRNLFYVAASRAKNVLTILHRSSEPSLFIKHYL